MIKQECLPQECLNCFQPNPKQCSKLQPFNPRSKYFILSIMLTDQCNRNCNFCWQKQSKLKWGTFTKDSLSNIFNFFYKNYPEYSYPIAVLGGEPSLFPQLLRHIAYTQLQLYQVYSLRVYTNGDNNIEVLYDLSEEFNNITYQVSKNYEMIKYKNFKKYIELASIYCDENTNINSIIDKVKYLKEVLGYQHVYLNFNVNNEPLNNKILYFNNMLKLLQSLSLLTSENFHIDNLQSMYGHSMNFIDINKQPMILQAFPNEKFYISHYKLTKPVGDIINGLDLNKVNSLYTNNPCLICNNKFRCGFDHMPYFVEYDLNQKKYDNVCLSNLINAIATKQFNGGKK